MIERCVPIEVNNKLILVSNRLNINEAIRKFQAVPTTLSNGVFVIGFETFRYNTLHFRGRLDSQNFLLKYLKLD